MTSTFPKNKPCDNCDISDCDIKNYIAEIESNCQFFSFADCLKMSYPMSICNVLSLEQFTTEIKLFPSLVIQAKLELEALCVMDLKTLKPAQLQKLSKLKRELINIINQTKLNK